MFDGTLRRVEDVRAGDLLMGDDSTPRRVLSLARGRENMYWVRQNKGDDYRVNESHILSLKRSPQ
ncbi:MAG: Hint domain-containing homing endonuclease [Hymenobacter sp.]